MQGHPHTRPLILSAGFPCQQASTANSYDGSGIEGAQTGLVWEALRIVDELEPEYLFLENVAGIVTRDRGWGEIVRALAERGYCTWYRTVSASSYGYPFKGERLLGVAFSPAYGLGLEAVEFFDSLFVEESKSAVQQHLTREVGSLLEPENYGRLVADDNGLPPQLVGLRLHAIGNSIQPVFSEIIFKTIKAFHETVIAA